MRNNQIIETFAKNGLNADLLTSQQRFLTEQILIDSPQPNEKSLKVLRQYKRDNFVYEVLTNNKNVSIHNRLRVLTANVLCFPNPFCYFFGGVSPWENRIDNLVKKILSTKADIVCLQEVWEAM